jgi:CHASE3 domain sensor protein
MLSPGGKRGMSAPPGLRINIVALLLAFILLLAILVAAGLLALRQTSAQTDVRRSIEVINTLNSVMTGLLDAETGQRGYIVTGDPSYLQPFNESGPKVLAEIQRLRQATQGEAQNVPFHTRIFQE